MYTVLELTDFKEDIIDSVIFSSRLRLLSRADLMELRWDSNSMPMLTAEIFCAKIYITICSNYCCENFQPRSLGLVVRGGKLVGMRPFMPCIIWPAVGSVRLNCNHHRQWYRGVVGGMGRTDNSVVLIEKLLTIIAAWIVIKYCNHYDLTVLLWSADDGSTILHTSWWNTVDVPAQFF